MAFDLKKIVGSVAPWLATALGGPIAGQAVSAIANALGLPSSASQEDVEKALSAGQLTGDNLVALKQAELNFQAAMQQAGFANEEKLAELAEQDRDSARKREMTVQDWTPRILAYGVSGGFFAVLWFMLTTSVPDGAKDPLYIMLGALQTAWAGIIAYYFGSSSGSAQKTALLAQAPAIPAAPAKRP